MKEGLKEVEAVIPKLFKTAIKGLQTIRILKNLDQPMMIEVIIEGEERLMIVEVSNPGEVIHIRHTINIKTPIVDQATMEMSKLAEYILLDQTTMKVGVGAIR